MSFLTFWQIGVFVGIGLLCLIGLAYLAYRYKKDNFRVDQWWFIAGFVLLAAIGMFTARNYVYPSKNIFNNTRYHILEHSGFEFTDSLSLANSIYPEESLWDSKSGTILLKRNKDSLQFTIKNYYEPFYLTQGNYFVLQNNFFTADVSQGLSIIKDADTILQLKIIPFEKENKKSYYYLVRTAQSAGFDTSSFTQPVYRGYPLLDILLNTKQIQPGDEIKTLLEGALLARDSIAIENRRFATEVRDENNSALRFVPKLAFYEDPRYILAGSEAPGVDTTFTVQAQDHALFYSGSGFSKTDVFNIDFKDNYRVRISYILPRMQPLRDEEINNQLFITSSVDEVQHHELKGGYLYNIFESKKNLNNINATVRYLAGSPEEAMYFKVKDLYSNTGGTELIRADTLIQLKSLNSGNQLTWLMQFHNLRATNSLQLKHINWFIGVFLLLLSIRVYLDNRSITSPFRVTRPLQRLDFLGSFSLVEWAIYIVIFCFTMVRLILAWRMSTFVPIEDIDAARFSKLRDGYSVFLWSLLIIVPAFLLLFAVKLINNTPTLGARFNNLLSRRSKRKPTIAWITRQGKLVWIYFLIMALVLLVSNKLPDILERLVNIPLPIILYFIFDIRLLKARDEDEIPEVTHKFFPDVHKFIYVNYPRILLWLLTFAYLGWQDSGFGIIFLLYGILHHVFSRYFFESSAESKNDLRRNWLYIFIITVCFCGFLYWQSELILATFKNTYVWTTTAAIVLFAIALFVGFNTYFRKHVRYITAAFCTAIAIILLLVPGQVSEALNKHKSYLKYRAEIQLPDFNIENLIQTNKFKSSDITFILRSAHNQWFINLYNNSKPDKYFTIQPHFNQGSSFTTQTTDLVVTRYLLAEHPVMVIALLMLMLLMLPLIFTLSMNIKAPKLNFSVLGVFILLFSIALFVYLSATNRVVFFGQDFPFISITSKIAVAFPVLIFLIAIINSWYQREPGSDTNEDASASQKGMFILAVLVITLSAVAALTPKNKGKDEKNFNISALIEKTAVAVEGINNEFNNYQYNKKQELVNIPVDSLISNYVRDTDQSQKFQKALHDTNNIFLSSLLHHFTELPNKWDPNELLHIRKRNAYYNIIVNRKYYFITSFKAVENEWRGHLLAAQRESRLGFMNKRRKLFVPEISHVAIIPNILDVPATKDVPELKYRDSLNNITIMKIDASMTANNESLYLIKSDRGDNAENKANFHIYNDTNIIHGDFKYPAMCLLAGDLLELDIKKERSSKTVIKWNVVDRKDDYLARNLWLNGRQNLYYPLGTELMWSYNFANLVRQKRVDSCNLRVSIDYELSRNIYDIIDKENKTKLALSGNISNQLVLFRELDYATKKQHINPTGIYLSGNEVKISNASIYRDNKQLKEAIAWINKRLQLDKADDQTNNGELIKTINEATEKQFDYSAVVLDGYGRIRSISDYSRFTKTDPNNIRDFNRFLSNLYKESSVSTEKDFFGNKSLSVINPGPGSSFKPIALTAITSKSNFGWEDLRIESVAPANIVRTLPRSRSKNKSGVAFYGGKSFLPMGERLWNLETYNMHGEGLSADKYIVHSNNLFHSAVMFLGSQSDNMLQQISRNGKYDLLFKDISANARRDSSTFPVFIYKNRSLVLDPDKWLQTSDYFGSNGSVFSLGLQENFRLAQTSLGISDTGYYNSFGNDSTFASLFNSGISGNFIWSYPEISAFNQLDRTVRPRIRNGLIQPSLGSFPLKVTPLQMASMGMRLVSLNQEEFITTLQPDSNTRKPYRFFTLSQDWDTVSFLKFHQKYVFKQLFEVINGTGTASDLRSKLAKYISKGFHFYAKTGTINIQDDDNERGKHLLVIITNKKLEDIGELTVEELKRLRYYVIFMSYHGIDLDEFYIGNFYKIISATMNSELFSKYMNRGL